MHLGQVATAFSELFTLPLTKVQSTCRFLRQAGFIRSGARGVNAPHLEDLEIARILIALMASESPSDSVVRCRYFSALPVDPIESRFSKAQTEKHENQTAETVLAKVFQGIREGRFDRDPDSSLSRGGVSLTVEISMGRMVLEVCDTGERVIFSTDPDPRKHDLVTKDHETLPPFFSTMHRSTNVMGDVLNVIASFGNETKSKGDTP